MRSAGLREMPSKCDLIIMTYVHGSIQTQFLASHLKDRLSLSLRARLAARSPESRLSMNFFAALQERADLQLGSKQIAFALSLLSFLR